MCLSEAVHIVAMMSLEECRKIISIEPESMLKSVCEWKVGFRQEFDELRELMGRGETSDHRSQRLAKLTPGLVKLSVRIEQSLQKGSWTVPELAQQNNCTHGNARTVIYQLRRAGHQVIRESNGRDGLYHIEKPVIEVSGMR